MGERTGADQARRARLILAHVASSVWRRGTRVFVGVGLISFRPPGRLLIAPPDIRTADPTVAADIYAGYFVFDGKAVNTHGRSPFALDPPSPAWARSLAEFGWLRHLRAADTSLARVNARALVGDWIAQASRTRKGVAWAPETAARRMLAWLSQSPIILEGADGFFYRKFMQSLGRHAAFLRRSLATGLVGEPRLFVAIALTEMSLCSEGFDKARRHAIRVLIDEIGLQILPDGGHIGRDPAVTVEMLLYMLPLRQAFLAADVAVPPSLLNAIDRMIPMVRAFRHGDGALALFNGMGVTRPEVLATVLAYDDSRGRPLMNAPYAGYQRLEAGPSIVIMDAGPPPPVEFSRHAHAGTLAFEFSVGAQQFIVNCGAAPAALPEGRNAARATAAHSTLVLADRSSSRFIAGRHFGRRLQGVLYAGPTEVLVSRIEEDGALRLDASHDGYLSRFGLVHRRRLALAAGGLRLEGEDRLASVAPKRVFQRRRAAAQAFVLRFHLHPAVRIRTIREGAGALIAFPNGDLWVFEAGGLPIRIEESIYFAGADGARRTEQFVVLGHSLDQPIIAWSLSRRDAADLPAPTGSESRS